MFLDCQTQKKTEQKENTLCGVSSFSFYNLEQTYPFKKITRSAKDTSRRSTDSP